MRHTLILLLLLPLFSFGQGGFYVGSTKAKPVSYDTVPALMLICDTSYLNTYMDIHTSGGKVYWTKGYAIKENTNQYYYKGGILVPIKETIGYLDKFKRPLRKTTVVWISKEY